ncbi:MULTISPECIES: S41 family peptidase [unclassified Myroides]|uniref:S41 family peptidase n=1 Tax=unclassified Myroides TaxID=2642485 RepID=UPI003D2F79AA
MRYKLIKMLIVFLFSLMGFSQQVEEQLIDLDFEQVKGGYPIQWIDMGDEQYKIYADSVQVQSGKYSVVIENTGMEAGYKALALVLPQKFKGDSIRLSGYIKTENVTEGYAGLWMRIDPMLAFDNMDDRGVIGTTAWQKYEITLPLDPAKAEGVYIGGLLVGKGKMWLDHLQVTIDGKTLDDPTLEVYVKEPLPADLDKEFDAGSAISISNPTAETIANLELLGKIWGFLKYHHPEVGKGNYNWDYELFRVLPAYLKVKNKEDRDEVLLQWIKKYGPLAPCETCEPVSKDAVLQPDFYWMKQFGMSKELQGELQQVYARRNQGSHYYVVFENVVGSPRFDNENIYASMPYPDSGFRLLAVYKYWSMIEYFFPSKHLTDKKWEEVLKEYIPVFLDAKDELEYELAAIQLIGEIHDTHANLWGGGDKFAVAKGNHFAPFKVSFVEDQLVVVDYFNPELMQKEEISLGDVITHINGETVAAMVNRLRPYYPASNEAARLRDIAEDALRSSTASMSITYQKAGKTKQMDLVLYPEEELNRYRWYKVDDEQRSFRLLDQTIGYVTLANIQKEDIPEIKQMFKDTKGIIIDIRNYPTAFTAFDLGGWFVDQATPFVKFTVGDVNNPGTFVFTPLLEIPNDKEPYTGKIVVLVNAYTQSQAEYTAMAFRAGKNTTIVGSTTSGADGDMAQFHLPGGLRTAISGIGVYYPDGTETQRIGIIPDIIVRPTIEGIKKGKDELLEKALEIVKK